MTSKLMDLDERLEKAEKALDLDITENKHLIIMLQLEYIDTDPKKMAALKKSGFLLPPQAKQGGSLEVFEATIMKVGSAVKAYTPGERVIFTMNSFKTVTRNGFEFLLIADKAIVAKVIEKG